MTHVRSQRGQITVLLALCAIPIALALAFIFNSADLFSRKQRVQDAADAAAVAQGAWMARSLNAMATNNVALTQTEVINALAAAVNLTVIDLHQYLARQAVQWTITAVATCPIGGVLNPKCDEALLRLAAIYVNLRLAEDLIALVLRAQPEFVEHARAYAGFNDRLANGFADFSADMQRRLAQTNGMTEMPRMQAVGWDGRPGLFSSVDRTGLPVTRIDAPAILQGRKAGDMFSTTWAALRPVYTTGNDGSSGMPPRALNFDSHGYTSGRGPYRLARDHVKDTLSRAVDVGRALGWSASFSDEEPKFDECWETTSYKSPIAPIAPLTCKDGVAVSHVLLPLYAPAAPPRIDNPLAWGVTDVVVMTKSTRRSGVVAARRFPNALPAAFAFAKARVYSATAPDLYTADWRATLVPVMSWTGSTTMPPRLRVALQNLVRTEPDLARSLARLSDREMLHVITQ